MPELNLKTLFHDDRGAVLSIEMILTATIVVLASIVGLSTFRNAVVEELGDVAAGVSSLNHSYNIDGIISYRADFGSVVSTFSVLGSNYLDDLNSGEPDDRDPDSRPPMGIEINSRSTIIDENQPLP